MAATTGTLSFHLLTPDRWPDLEALFGERGACGGCWCMWWRLARKNFEANKGAKNKRALQRLVSGGHEPGILAYQDGEPVGWCAIEPRANYPVLARSRVLKPIDDRPVWSITCFFIRRDLRGQGLSIDLIAAAVAQMPARGAPKSWKPTRWSPRRDGCPMPSPGRACPPPSRAPASRRCCGARPPGPS